jgi:hypothetical protein
LKGGGYEMATIYTLKLSAADVFQIIDALNSRADAYQQTACYLSDGCEVTENNMLEECSDSFEAQEIASHFQDIIKTIEKQM